MGEVPGYLGVTVAIIMSFRSDSSDYHDESVWQLRSCTELVHDQRDASHDINQIGQ